MKYKKKVKNFFFFFFYILLQPISEPSRGGMSVTDKVRKNGCLSIVLLVLKGGATLHLRWTTNPNPRALTLFFKVNVQYFDQKWFEGTFRFVWERFPQKYLKVLALYESS